MVDDGVRKDFRDAVNMTAGELERWLATDDSKAVGQKPSGGGESTGHHMGREIVRLLRTKKSDLSEDDERTMRTVVGYVRRHLAQGGPDDRAEVEGSPWRHSLMNWGHDPLARG